MSYKAINWNFIYVEYNYTLTKSHYLIYFKGMKNNN